MMLRRGSPLARASLRRATLATGASTGVAVGHSGHLSADEAARRSELRNAHDGPAVETAMSHKEKYLFDLNGYVVLRGAFDADMVSRANTAVDAHLDQLHERTGQLRTSGLYGRASTELAGDGSTGRADLGGMLGWAAPHREPFREVLCHPPVVRLLSELLAPG